MDNYKFSAEIMYFQILGIFLYSKIFWYYSFTLHESIEILEPPTLRIIIKSRNNPKSATQINCIINFQTDVFFQKDIILEFF
jgi:hypothetical protein